MRFSLNWKFPGDGLQRVGEHTALPEAFTARWEHETDHTVEMDVKVIGGQPVCDAIRVQRNPARPPLSGAELRRLPVANWLAFACQQAALRAPGGGLLVPITTEAEAAEAADEIGRRLKRRRVTDELLREVASVYNSSDDAPEAVKDTFYVSLSQAFRYIKKAREAGFITEKGD